MTPAPMRGEARDPGWPVDRRPFDSPAVWKVLVPGWPQSSWGQCERGSVLLTSFAVALGIGLSCWGTWLGWFFFAFAFITHVMSATDALRQSSFPVYPGRTALVVTA